MTVNNQPRCVVLTEAQCTAQNGTWGGANTLCQPTSCRPSDDVCPCDRDGDGDSDQEDIASFMEAYMQGNADFNNDGETTPADLEAFVRCFHTDPDC